MKYIFGIIGLGDISHRFAKTLNYLGIKFKVASRSIEKAKAFQKEYGCLEAYGSYEELLKDEEVDAIYISTPHGLHYENILECIKHNKHVICEKALVLNAKQAEDIKNKASEKRLLVMEAMWSRFIPMWNKIKYITQEEKYGKVKSIEADFIFKGNLDKNYRLMNKHLGGGSLLDVGVYPLNFINMMVGHPKEIKALAKLTETGVDEYTSVILKYDDFIANFNVGFNITYKNNAIIYYDNAYIELVNCAGAQEGFVFDYNHNIIEHLEIPFADNGFEYQVLSFIDSLNKKELQNQIMPLDESIEILKQIDEMRRQIGVKYEGE